MGILDADSIDTCRPVGLEPSMVEDRDVERQPERRWRYPWHRTPEPEHTRPIGADSRR